MQLQEKTVQAALTRLDPLLYLDKLFDKEGQYIYYAVRYPVENGLEPLTCVHWRTIDGPLPLSLDLVDLVRRQEGDIREEIKKATINNALKRNRINTELMEDFEERQRWREKSSKRHGIYGPWSPKYDLR